MSKVNSHKAIMEKFIYCRRNTAAMIINTLATRRTKPLHLCNLFFLTSINYRLPFMGRYTPSAANQTLSGRFSRTPQTCKRTKHNMFYCYQSENLRKRKWMKLAFLFSEGEAKPGRKETKTQKKKNWCDHAYALGKNQDFLSLGLRMQRGKHQNYRKTHFPTFLTDNYISS